MKVLENVFRHRGDLHTITIVKNINDVDFLKQDCLTIIHLLSRWCGASLSMPYILVKRGFISQNDLSTDKEVIARRFDSAINHLQKLNLISIATDKAISYCGSWSCTVCIYHVTSKCLKGQGYGVMVGGSAGKHCSFFSHKSIGVA